MKVAGFSKVSTPCVLLDEVFLQKIGKPAKGAETRMIRIRRGKCAVAQGLLLLADEKR